MAEDEENPLQVQAKWVKYYAEKENNLALVQSVTSLVQKLLDGEEFNPNPQPSEKKKKRRTRRRRKIKEKEKEEKWVKYYCRNHQILLVGDGDFSFSLSLALSFGSASNIVASSLDSYDVLIKKYSRAKSNLEKLASLGVYILHEVDATRMKHHSDLKMRRFDRIIFNFPHAGFHGKEDNAHLIKMHKNLVRGFFRNASGMLQPNGEIHVNHKTTAPFCCWKLEELACQSSLVLIECVDFKREDYPGYHNKRGAGARCDMPFPLGECSTFKFILSSIASRPVNPSPFFDYDPGSMRSPPLIVIRREFHTHQHPNSFQVAQPAVNPSRAVHYVPGSVCPPTGMVTRGDPASVCPPHGMVTRGEFNIQQHRNLFQVARPAVNPSTVVNCVPRPLCSLPAVGTRSEFHIQEQPSSFEFSQPVEEKSTFLNCIPGSDWVRSACHWIVNKYFLKYLGRTYGFAE